MPPGLISLQFLDCDRLTSFIYIHILQLNMSEKNTESWFYSN